MVAVGSPLVDELTREVDRLIGQVRHWGAPRWAAPAVGTSEGTRGDLVHDLVQRLADRCAEVEGEPRRRVPRLDSDLALVDQLRVISADLVAAAGTTGSAAGTTGSAAGATASAADPIGSAAAEVAAVRRML